MRFKKISPFIRTEHRYNKKVINTTNYDLFLYYQLDF